MKKGIILFIIAVQSVFICWLFMRHNVEVVRVFRFRNTDPNPESFYPWAFNVIESYEELQSLLGYSKSFGPEIYDVADTVDFKRHSLLLTYGAPIETAYHSTYCGLVYDESPEYCNSLKNGLKFLKIKYKEPDGYNYIYIINGGKLLTGYNGL